MKKTPIKRRDILRFLSGAAVSPFFPCAYWMPEAVSANQRHVALPLLLGHLRDRAMPSEFSAYASLLGNLQLIRG